jgi:peptidoglycan hydrolase-like protein with peptidoglycan-binding domain
VKAFSGDSAILVTEDDAQDGVDHVDGHRAGGLVISPFVKRNVVDSTYYNQLSIIRIIEQILGLPPMNQHDLVTPPMQGLFTNTPNYATYTALKNNIPLNQLTTQQTASRTSKLQLTGPRTTISRSSFDPFLQASRGCGMPGWGRRSLWDENLPSYSPESA